MWTVEQVFTHLLISISMQRFLAVKMVVHKYCKNKAFPIRKTDLYRSGFGSDPDPSINKHKNLIYTIFGHLINLSSLELM
jgi:hypothetical protein